METTLLAQLARIVLPGEILERFEIVQIETDEGTRYSKEFAAFLKETYGDIPSDLPYA